MCDVGKYTAKTGSTSCSDCKRPVGAEFKSSGISDEGCAWTISCNVGYHYVSGIGCQLCSGHTFTNQPTIINGKGGSASTTQCTNCGANSTVNDGHTSCNCNENYHIKGLNNNATLGNGATECELNKYTIRYMSGDGSTKTKEITHGEPVTLLTESAFTKTGYKLSNWTQEKSSTTYAPGATISDGFTSDITLTAIWTPKEFTVTYDVTGATNCGLGSPKCIYGKSGCTAPDVKNCTKPGYTFGGWSCTSGCNSGVGTIGTGTDISKLSDGNNMTLKVNWVPCDAGYYCTDLTMNPCPAGSTSGCNEGKCPSAITDCYMTGGIKIYDSNNNYFELPSDVGKIYYHNGI